MQLAASNIDELVAGGRSLEEALLEALALDLEGLAPRETPFKAYAHDPVGFAKEVIGLLYLTKKQEEILISVRDNRETNVLAAHAVGKTFIAAIIVLWWVFAVGGLCPTTAPTQRQVNDLLWRYIRIFYDRLRQKLGGDRTALRMWFQKDISEAWGFTASPHSSEGFAGIHEKKLLAIQDEASGIAETTDEGFRSCLAGQENRGLRIGNPLAPGTPFYKACVSKSGSTIKIRAFDHPNVSWAYDSNGALKEDVARGIVNEAGGLKPRSEWPTDYPRADLIDGAISIEWIEGTRERYGRNSPYWVSRVEADFPQESPQSLVPKAWFDAARARYDNDPSHWDMLAAREDWVHGLDVGDGIDDHAIASRRGPVLYSLQIFHTIGDRQDTARAAGYLAQALGEKPGRGVVDRMGVGAGTLAMLLKEGKMCTGAAVGSRDEIPATDREAFMDLRGWLFWKRLRREFFETGQGAIAPLGDMEERLREELATIQYEPHLKGVRIEKKDDTKKRLGRSPDAADSFALTYAQPYIVRVGTKTKEAGRRSSRWRK